MKKSILLISVLLALSFTASSQKNYNTSDIFTIPGITWFGLDFSHVKMIGSEGFVDPDAIVNKEFKAMNAVIMNEPDKYDLKKFFDKKTVEIDMSVVRARNKLPDPDELVLETMDEYEFGRDKVEFIINEYAPAENEGIGLVFIMEKFNKPEVRGYMWVTFFDIASKKVLLTEKMDAKAGGFTWRNYWVKTCYNVMKEIGKKKYKSWEKEYR